MCIALLKTFHSELYHSVADRNATRPKALRSIDFRRSINVTDPQFLLRGVAAHGWSNTASTLDTYQRSPFIICTPHPSVYPITHVSHLFIDIHPPFKPCFANAMLPSSTPLTYSPHIPISQISADTLSLYSMRVSSGEPTVEPDLPIIPENLATDLHAPLATLDDEGKDVQAKTKEELPEPNPNQDDWKLPRFPPASPAERSQGSASSVGPSPHAVPSDASVASPASLIRQALNVLRTIDIALNAAVSATQTKQDVPPDPQPGVRISSSDRPLAPRLKARMCSMCELKASAPLTGAIDPDRDTTLAI